MSNVAQFCGWQYQIADQEYQRLASHFLPFVFQGDVRNTPGTPIWEIAKKVLGGKLPPTWYQKTGDCHIAGTLVTMADGTEKPIEEVQVGDFVLSHTGHARRVIDTIAKNYSGDLVSLKLRGCLNSITSTPDHQFITYPGLNYGRQNRSEDARTAWQAIGEICENTRMLLPGTVPEPKQAEILDLTNFVDGTKADKNDTLRFTVGKHRCNRHIVVGQQFAWLVGIYLAEGGISKSKQGKPHRIVFSLNKAEGLLAEQIIDALQNVFGVSAKAVRMPSKPNVLQVYCNCAVLACFFKQLIPGNVYDKRIPACLLRARHTARLACLRGWMDGDGNFYTKEGKTGTWCRATGVSAATDLCRDMLRLAMSCGLKATWSKRKKAKHQTRSAQALQFYGEHAVAVCPTKAGQYTLVCRPAAKAKTDLGLALPVKRLDRQYVENIQVYCLGVEEEHSFIANGFASHNCVSMGAAQAGQYMQIFEMSRLGQEELFKLWFPPYIYATSRVDIGRAELGRAPGSTGAWAVEAMRKFGVLFMDDPGVPQYSRDLADSWGYRGVGKQFKDLAADNPVKGAAKLTSADEIRLALCNWKMCTYAIMWAYDTTPYTAKGKSGREYPVMRRADTKGGHQVCLLHWNDDIDGAFCLNSWSDRVHGPSLNGEPKGGAYIPRREIERDLRGYSEVYALSDFQGFKGEADYGFV